MADYTQANRPLRVDTALGEDALLLSGFNGFEAVSQPYSFQLDMLSTDAEIDPASLLRTPVLLTVSVADEEKRYFHGIVSRFAPIGMRDELAFYRAEIVPWLWFLTLSRESRIYQELTVPDILEQVFKRAGYSDFEFRLKRTYGQRLFCVQYRESHLAFVSRLMEEEGIFYFFEHTTDKHVLVLTDDSSGSAPVTGPESIRFSTEGHTDEYVVSELEREHRVHPGRMTLWEYDYLKPTTRLDVKQGEEAEEVYDYPGGYREHDEGDLRARMLLEAEEAERQVVRGVSTATGLAAGFHFKLDGHFQRDANGKYLVTQVQHIAHAGGYRAWENDAQLDYRNDFQCIPHGTPYRPRRRTPRPVIHGSQSALVVGPAGEEVHTDNHGRVKVHFYWDRDSQKNEKSSCWIRVTTPWAGKGWGSVSIPRIGNEVIVAFEEGDPDRPIIIGSVYNAEQTPPFSLPGAGIQQGMKSRSSPGGGGMNEITMTDTKGKEMMNVHAQFDQVTTVENDQTNTINNNRKTTVAVDDTESVGVNQTMDVGSNQTLSVGANQSTTVGGNRTLSVSGNQDVSVGGNESVTVGGNRSTSVGGSDATTVGGAQTVDVGGDQTVNIGGSGAVNAAANHALAAGADVTVDAGGNVSITGGAKITLSAGGSTIEIGPSGINIQTGAIVSVTGATIKLN